MGYSINISPPRRWFSGRLFLQRARESYNQAGEAGSVGGVLHLSEARLNVVRAIRAALVLPPDPEKFDEMLDELESRMDSGRFNELNALWNGPYQVMVIGTNQYGPEFDLKNRSTGELVSARAEEARGLLDRAVGERRLRTATLLTLARKIFFHDVYLKDKERELLLYDIRQSMETIELHQVLIDAGLAGSTDDALARFGTDWPFADPAAESAFRDRQMSGYKSIHEEQFWEFEEGLSIAHQFVD